MRQMLRTGVTLIIVGLLIIGAVPVKWASFGAPPESNLYYLLGLAVLLIGIVFLFVKRGRNNPLEAPSGLPTPNQSR